MTEIIDLTKVIEEADLSKLSDSHPTEQVKRERLARFSFVVDEGNTRVQKAEEHEIKERLEDIIKEFNMKLVEFEGPRTYWSIE